MGGGWQHDVRDGGVPLVDDPPLRPNASKVELTANARKQDAYAAQRRAWTARWNKPVEPEPPAPDQPTRPARGRGGPIHDKRQGRLEV